MTGPSGSNGSGRIRAAAAIVILTLVAFLVIADVVGRLAFDNGFHASDVMLGTLIGALLLLVGIDVSRRWPWGNGNGGNGSSKS